MKHRFYYSEQQAEIERSCDHFFAYVTLPSGEQVRYTEWCSSPESVCGWDDAVLVYESDEMPRVVTEPNADYCEEEPPFWEEGYDEYEVDLDADFIFDNWDEGPDIGSFYDPRNNPEED